MDQKYDGSFWLDATRVLQTDSSDSFYWSNGDQLTYTNWVVGEPNGNRLGDIEGVEVCISVQPPSSPMSLQWGDVPCHRDCNRRSICERPCCI